ncbi:hypothetical protein FisN_3Lh063 [Fistulifera solaris]|uniref:5'-nucleotidase n=1 Tax=Fistulifera solaris TaxID=1519565 RepID=A0A1Z5JYK9_FISSO|nr:hypothetical protein FisN_3Lh063 [Fistulifera solaris]|eukprot:GAX19123.1 hypothetical protein FisN_3Lh063 [Fistulifera solaris]
MIFFSLLLLSLSFQDVFTFTAFSRKGVLPTLRSQVDDHTTTTKTTTKINENEGGRYDKLLKELNLDLPALARLPKKHTITPFDVFCNRELKLEGIQAIGFDMDYTLAQYNETTFAELAFDGAKRKLVESLGYPEEVLDFTYDPAHWVRGLIIDTQRGNFLKIDRHKYVRVARHGFEVISSTTRKHLYSRQFNKVMSFTEKQFVNMDTLFQFVDAHLFASLIELKDKGDYEELDYKTYEEIYRQVRECVDLCHRDGVIKDQVHLNPEPYVIFDKGMVPMLRRFRQEGIKLFLLTNSLWEYTSTVMNYLYHGERVPDERQKDNEWMELFDLVITGACKPAYMVDSHLNLFRVDPSTGTLRNTDGVYEIEALGPNGATKFLQKGKTFQGGNWLHLQAMLEIEAGEEILYVGDHLYSDVLRSKRTLGWRSVFIMPELEDEMKTFAANAPLARQIIELRKLREELGVLGEVLRRQADNPQKEQELNHLNDQDDLLKEKLIEMTSRWHAAFHPIWGAMFHAGYQDSRFAFYVQNYACVYTSRASNLGLWSKQRSFRTSMEMLSHDRLLFATDHTDFAEVDPWTHIAE